MLPEAFNVMVKELQSLSLQVDLVSDKENIILDEEGLVVKPQPLPESDDGEEVVEEEDGEEDIDEMLTELAAEQTKEDEDIVATEEEVVE